MPRLSSVSLATSDCRVGASVRGGGGGGRVAVAVEGAWSASGIDILDPLTGTVCDSELGERNVCGWSRGASCVSLSLPRSNTPQLTLLIRRSSTGNTESKQSSAMSTDLAIGVNDLDFAYAQLHGVAPRPVLHDVTLNLPKGSRCLLVGSNGAGESPHPPPAAISLCPPALTARVAIPPQADLLLTIAE